MKTSVDKFEIELDGLLKRYFNDDELCCLNLNIIHPKEGSDKVTRMINDFYRNQLQLDINNCSFGSNRNSYNR